MNKNEQPLNNNKYEGEPTGGIPENNLLSKDIDQTLREHFNSSLPFLHMVHFAYAVDIGRQQVCYQNKFSEYLGYTPESINVDLLTEILHPEEQDVLTSLYGRLHKFSQHFTVEPLKYGLILGHQLRKFDGSYIKILRYIHPFLLDDHNNLLVYYCLCVDVSNHRFNKGITLDIILAPDAPFTRAEVQKYFKDVKINKNFHFTRRQLEVVKIWSETDSAKVAAERLSMKIRTLETHLKNLRKKLGVRRTLDVVVYAKDNKLI